MKIIFLAVLGTFALFCSASSASADVDVSSTIIDTESLNTGSPTDATNSPPSESTTNSADPTQTTIITNGPTTTMSPSSTTEKPTPWEWHVDDETKVCIIAKFHAEIEINYLKTDNSTSKGYITVPENAKVSNASHCGNDTQVLQIEFKNGNNTGSAAFSHIHLTFSKTKDNIVIVSDIEILINNVNNTFEGAKVNDYHGGKSNTSLFGTDAGHSYICTKSSVDFGPLGSISFTDFQVEAFRATNDVTFSLAEDCNTDVNNIVPIAVGCSLAALVVVVLVAYLIGRRQKRQRGYESV